MNYEGVLPNVWNIQYYLWHSVFQQYIKKVTMIFCAIIYVLNSYLNMVAGLLSPDIIIDMTEHFKIHNPTIIVNDTNFKTIDQIKLFKMFMNHGHEISFNFEDSKRNQSFVVFSQMQNFHWEIHTEVPVLVVSKILNGTDFEHTNLPLDAEVYFVDYDTLKVYESYTINKVFTERYLGKFKIENNHAIFYEAEDFISSFVKRRGNFHGLQLKGKYTF